MPVARKAFRIAKRAWAVARAFQPQTRILCHPGDTGRLGLLSASTLESYDAVPHLGTTATGLVRRLTDVSQGDAQSQRNGNAIDLVRYVDRLEFVISPGNTVDVETTPFGVRILIYQVIMQDTTPTSLNIAQMLWTTAVANTVEDESSITAIYRPFKTVPTDQQRDVSFKILYDKKFWMMPQQAGAVRDVDAGTLVSQVRGPRRFVSINLSWPKGKRIYYGGATTADVQNPLIMAIFASRDAAFNGGNRMQVGVRHLSTMYWKDV